jgi:hypothetical protein
MFVLAVRFFPAAYELVVRSSDKVAWSDTDPAIAWDGAADIQANTHPDGLVSNQEGSLEAIVSADTVS